MISPFKLRDPRAQKDVSFGDFKSKKAIVVVFLGTECPINNLFLPVLAKMHKEFSSQGVQFLGINSNVQDTSGEVANHARLNDLPFPVLKDVGNKVADNFKAERTPEAFLLSPKGMILYRGRIDDQFGINYQRPNKPTRRDLVEAIKETLAGKKVSIAKTKVEGCLIGRNVDVKKAGKVTFYRDILPILQNNCQGCHRKGQIGPMPLKDYEDVVAWSGTIDEVVTENRMPPWHADPHVGKFANDRRLPDADKKKLLSWIRDGMPKGNVKESPKPKKFPEGWVIGKPDVIIKMPKKFSVPAEVPPRGVPYKYFSVATNFKEDKWVVRAEAKPGAPSVVHHIIVFVVPPGQFFNPERPGAVLVGTAPGDLPTILPEGYAKKVPKGSKLIFQMHYTPNGKAQVDQSMIGLIFAKKPPKHTTFTFPIIPRTFLFRLNVIPPGHKNYRMSTTHTFKKDAKLLSLMPHMHLRGKSFRYVATYPNGKKETLLWVPRYDFNWQTIYRLKEPKLMPKGTKLLCVAHFDNSKENLNNPDPSKKVRWGDQTWEEMMIGWIDYANVE